MSIDLLAVAPHPDDAELGAAGLLLLAKAAGLRTAIVDLTRGEMGSKGDPDTRAKEAAAAAEVLGLSERCNLDLGDGALRDTDNNRRRLAETFRELQPRVVLTNYRGDRHPDHAATWNLVQGANLWARLKNSPAKGESHSVEHVFQYFIHDHPDPTLVVDITAYFERKMEAVKCYRSQFIDYAVPEGYRHIGTADYIRDTETRARFLGSLIRADYGEGYYTESTLRVADPRQLLEF